MFESEITEVNSGHLTELICTPAMSSVQVRSLTSINIDSTAVVRKNILHQHFALP